jgi:prevent-host-death family protein
VTKISANDAKARFGELLDTARREAVTIEKHGRPVAVVLSIEDYEELAALKLSRLRAEIDIGLRALENDDFVEVDGPELQALVAEIQKAGRKNSSG